MSLFLIWFHEAFFFVIESWIVFSRVFFKNSHEHLSHVTYFLHDAADNIYYSDPDRANLYLGGGAVPKNEQSIAYLLRNDILTNLENLQAEVAYLIKETNAGNPLETEDLYPPATYRKGALFAYFVLFFFVPFNFLKYSSHVC